MAKLTISSYDAAALAAARRAGESRTHLWARIKNQLGIPPSMKLGMDTHRALYVKGTDPRVYLMAGIDGRFTYVDDFPVPQRTVEAPVTLHESGRFASEASQPTPDGWQCLTRDQLVAAMEDEGQYDPTLPAGFPEDATGFVFDSTTGSLYFR